MNTLIVDCFRWIYTPTAITESIAFCIGIVGAIALSNWGIQKRAEDEDSVQSHFNFWFLAPLGFIIAVATVYDKNNLHNHWLFGQKWLMPLIIFFTNFFFGISFGLLVALIWRQITIQFDPIWGNLKSFSKKISIALMEKLGPTQTLLIPHFWDRFKAETQIDYIENFLMMIDNQTDRDGLEFWKTRKQETEENGFTFRISLNNEELKRLDFKTFNEKNYLSIEFWRTKLGTFKARTTDGSVGDLRTYAEATPAQLGELEQYLKFWHKKLK